MSQNMITVLIQVLPDIRQNCELVNCEQNCEDSIFPNQSLETNVAT